VERKSFSFFISYWEAIEELPESQQLPVLKAIIKYAFFDEEPTQFKGIKRAVFLLVKPTLDNSKKKSANGKQGGSKPKANCKQSESKPKANRKQTPSDISEGIGEGEGEGIGVGIGEGEGIGVGIGEGEGKNIPRSDDSLFTAFWNAYPEHARSEREEAWEAWKKLSPTPDKAAEITACLEAWKAHKRWTDDDGAFVPAPKNFLKPEKLYMSSRPPSGKQASASGGDRKLDEDEIAAIKRMMSEMEETEA
jgi:hypothetical protein